VGHLLGTARFMGLELLADPGALAPRAETELLGATALKLLANLGGNPAELTAIDMCCGSGNLACGIAAAVSGLKLLASDLTDGCVSLARRNVEKLGLNDRVTIERGDLFGPLAGKGLEGKVDLVVCNPPYISTGRLEKDRATLLEHEPREAFDGGPYGLSIQQRVIQDAAHFLKPGGWLVLEMGLGQERQLKALFARSRQYDGFECVNDAAGAPRVALARKKAE
jgi:HemK-like putative methylase